MLRLPYRPDTYAWLRERQARKPKWNESFCGYWTIPRAWFDEVIERSLPRFGSIYVIQTHRPLEKCAPACWNAKGFDCECSCMGENHGSQHPDGVWNIISDTCAVQWGERQLACRLIGRIFRE